MTVQGDIALPTIEGGGTTGDGIQPSLAREAIALGGHAEDTAMCLADRAMCETASAQESVMAALSAVRLLVEHPTDLPSDTALAEFLANRMKQVLKNIGRN